MEPRLVQTQAEVNAMIESIDRDKVDAAATKAVVEKEEREASIKAAECKAIADDAERDLAEALPALDAAVQCLNKLKCAPRPPAAASCAPPRGLTRPRRHCRRRAQEV